MEEISMSAYDFNIIYNKLKSKLTSEEGKTLDNLVLSQDSENRRLGFELVKSLSDVEIDEKSFLWWAYYCKVWK